MVLVFRDITERQRNEAERRKAEALEQLGLLAGGIAHDFNNLLTAIIGNISLASLLLPSDNELTARLIDAKNASMRARDLAQQLLTFARGGAPIKKTASIGKLIQDTVSFSLRGTQSRSEFDFGQDLWPAEIDPGQISQVIANLVVNADQAMPNGGTLRVSCDNFNYTPATGPVISDLSPGEYIRISIHDEGVGIPNEYLKRIFDPYFTTKAKGTGLGLATTYSIVKNHNGLITVNSELHSGSTFTVYLPAAVDRAIPVETRPTTEPIPGTGRVLVVDDEEAIRALVEFTLNHLGYKVAQAGNALDGVNVYREKFEAGERFDAVILDLTLPGGMGGKDALKKLTRNRSDCECNRLQRLRHRCDHEPLPGFWFPWRDRQALRSRRARQNCARRDYREPRQTSDRTVRGRSDHGTRRLIRSSPLPSPTPDHAPDHDRIPLGESCLLAKAFGASFPSAIPAMWEGPECRDPWRCQFVGQALRLPHFLPGSHADDPSMTTRIPVGEAACSRNFRSQLPIRDPRNVGGASVPRPLAAPSTRETSIPPQAARESRE